ncbi:MAG: hypothetical protein GX128_08375 [Bacteroidales bacterium]|jgi:uncharacterized coiled-coil protein SlyX|nr:hypothetical protein [Bacteroidales bacterium]
MKKYLILLIPMLVLFFGCENKKQSERILALQIDSVRSTRLVQEKEDAINSLLKTLNEIEENLALIRSKESIISDQTGENREIKPDVQNRIMLNISDINDLMDKNKQLIKNLNAQVRSSNLKISELDKTIERINGTLAAKEIEISELKQNIKSLNIKIDDLNIKVGDLEKESTEKDMIIAERISEINKVWYIVGSRKDLRDGGIISRTGGFIGIGRVTMPSEDLMNKQFIEADQRELTEIPLNAGHVEIVTNHPAGSYQLIGQKPVEKLVITNPQEFWKTSKYLVISIK